MLKLIKIVDDLLDRLIALVLILVLLVGVYFTWDTAYVFNHAASARTSFRYSAGQDAQARPYAAGYVARLQLDDTGIDYPVMQGADNSEFVNKDPYGDYSLTGSIFLDSRSSPDFSDSYSLVYGHHMQADLMFGPLDRYLEEGFFSQHRTGTLTVGETEYRLTAFAVLESDARESVIFDLGECGEVIALAEKTARYYETPENTHILALSTCVDDRSTSRTVLLLTMTERGADQ